MIVLDTNVLSELMRAAPDAAVLAWMGRQPGGALHATSVAYAELRLGIALLPAGKRRDGLAELTEVMFAEEFAGRVLAFDLPAGAAYGEVASARRKAGRPIAPADAMIAAIARAHGAAVATRDRGGFEGCGVPVIDPWEAA